MGFLELNWSFAKRLPYAETQDTDACDNALFFGSLDNIDTSCFLTETNDKHWRSDFWIGFPF